MDRVWECMEAGRDRLGSGVTARVSSFLVSATCGQCRGSVISHQKWDVCIRTTYIWSTQKLETLGLFGSLRN